MRFLTFILATAALTSPALADTYWPEPGDIVTPHANGLHLNSADGTSRDGMPFGSPFHSALQTLVSIFGHDVSVTFPQECGEGPLVMVHFMDQITLMFQQDRLAGWMMINESGLQTSAGLHVGSARADLETEGPVSFFESGIGTEFGAGDLFGLLSEDGATVHGIWSGATCIFR